MKSGNAPSGEAKEIAPRRIYLRLVRECLHHPLDLILAVAGSIAAGLAGLSLAWLFKGWAEGPLLAGDRANLSGLLSKTAFLTIVIVLSLLVSRYFTQSVGQRLQERLRNRAITRLLEVRLSAARRFPTGEALSRLISDVGYLSGFVETGLKRLAGDGIVFLGSLAMMFVLEWKLALGACLLLPVVGLILTLMGGAVRRWTAAAQQAIGTLSATVAEQLRGLSAIKGYQAEDFEAERFRRQNESFRRRFQRVEWWSALLVATVFLVTGLGMVWVFGHLSRQVLAREMTPGELLTFCLYAAMTVEPLRRLAQVQTALQRSIAAAERVYEIVDLPDVEQRRGSPQRGAVRGEIAFEHAAFGYEPARRVLNGLSLSVPPRSRVAVAAPSGGGKTTLARLLVRFEEVQAGRVLLDGRDVRDWALASLRRAVCVVEQEPFIFSGRVLDNVRYGSWDAPRSKIEEAVRFVGLEALLRSLPLGLETELSEAGRDLSGGERQRIALARAVLRDPAVLVLDEATNALDSESEDEIFGNLEPWLARRTVLLFAHRLSTVARFPRVALLEGGRLLEEGSPSDLIARSSVFRNLFSEQTEGPAERGSRLASVALE